MKEMRPILLLVFAVIVFTLISGIGIIATVILGLFFWWRNKNFVKMLLLIPRIIYQIWIAIKYLICQIALTIDLIGNALAGELIEYIITSERNTLFGKGNVTISASVGDLELRKNLNKRGLKFTKLLSYIFEENHSVNAYLKYSNKC